MVSDRPAQDGIVNWVSSLETQLKEMRAQNEKIMEMMGELLSRSPETSVKSGDSGRSVVVDEESQGASSGGRAATPATETAPKDNGKATKEAIPQEVGPEKGQSGEEANRGSDPTGSGSGTGGEKKESSASADGDGSQKSAEKHPEWNPICFKCGKKESTPYIICQGSTPHDLYQGNLPSYEAATSSEHGEWVVLSDPGAPPYLFNTVTQRIHNLVADPQRAQSNPLVPEAVSIGFDMLGGQQRYPDAVRVADAGQSPTQAAAILWKEYTDAATGRQYWNNEITGERTWDSPFADNKQPPPPPSTPSPPVSPASSKASAPDIKETRDQWSRYTNASGAAVWYNHVTGKAQEKKPKCMMKYR